MKTFIRSVVPALVLLAGQGVASAHTGAGSTHGLLAGLGHPIGGLDHLLAMLAIGLWASQLGGRALWMVPLTFVAVMAAGGALAMGGIAIPFIEGGILVSVIGLGLLIALGVRLPVALGVAVAAGFALFHGAAHGLEMPDGSAGWLYASGFIVSTAALHATGLAIGLGLGRIPVPHLARACGLAVLTAGIVLAAG